MNRRSTLLAICVVAFVLGLLLLPEAALACPTCKESLGHSDPARANMVRGYFWSILFMMSMPFVILGGLSALFWWEIRKAKAKKLKEAEAAGELHVAADVHAEDREPAHV